MKFESDLPINVRTEDNKKKDKDDLETSVSLRVYNICTIF